MIREVMYLWLLICSGCRSSDFLTGLPFGKRSIFDRSAEVRTRHSLSAGRVERQITCRWTFHKKQASLLFHTSINVTMHIIVLS